MKKLLLAGLTLLGLVAPNQAKAFDNVVVPPVTELQNGGTYYIYDAHADDGSLTEQDGSETCRYAFRKPAGNKTGDQVIGTHNKPTTVANDNTNSILDNYSVWRALEIDAGVWQFQNVGNDLYIAGSRSGDNVTVDEEKNATSFVLEPVDKNGTFSVKIKDTDNTRWDGNGIKLNYAMVYWSEGNGHPIRFYEALADGDGYKIKAIGAWNVTYTYPAYNGKAITKTLLVGDGDDAKSYIPDIEFFSATGVLEQNSVVSEKNKDFNVQGKWNFPMVANHVYRMTLKPSDASNKNLWFDGTNARTRYSDVDEKDVDNNLFWYFKVETMTDEGKLPVTIHGVGMADDEGLEFGTSDKSHGKKSTKPTIWYVERSNAGSATDAKCFTLRHSEAESYVNDRDQYFSTWNSTAGKADNGSVLRIEELTDSDWEKMANGDATEDDINAAQANPTPDAIRDLVKKMYIPNEEVDAVIAVGDYIIETLKLGDDTDRTLWEGTKKDATKPMRPSEYQKLRTTVNDLLTSAASHMPKGGKFVKFRHTQKPLLMGVNNGILQRNGQENTTTFTLKPAEGGFTIYNEYTGAYLLHPAADNRAFTFVENPEEATIYTLDLETFTRNEDYGYNFGIKSITRGNASHPYLHSNANADETNVVRWGQGISSSWYIELSDEKTAANEYLLGAKAYFEVLSKSFGNKLGEYNVTAESKAAAEDAMKVGDNNSVEEKRKAGYTLRNVESALNMPEAGHIYMFSTADKSRYMSADNKGTNKSSMVEFSDADLLSTLFYFDGEYLVSLMDGKVLGDFNKNNANSWQTVLKSDANAGKYTFTEAPTMLGKYKVSSMENRFLYNGYNNVDAGDEDGKGGTNQEGFYWTIEERDEWIPLPGTSVNQTTLCLPVPMEIKTGVMTVYTAKVTNDKVVRVPLDGEVIPANTPVLVEFNGIDRNKDNNLVYLKKAAADVTVDVDNDLQGSIYAFKPESTVALRSSNAFEATNNDVVNGLQAYINSSDLHTVSTPEIETALKALTGKVFALKNTDVENNRGYLIYSDETDAVWTSYKNGVSKESVDAVARENDNYHWTLVEKDGKYYLYNLVAGKYASAYTPKGGNDSGNAEFAWSFSEYPTAIGFHFYDYPVVESLENATFNILGGENVGNERPGGMMIINNNTYPVPAVAGNNADDGCGFNIIVIPDKTPGEVASIETAIKTMESENNAAADYINDRDGKDENVDLAAIPGHYDEDAYKAFKEALKTGETDDVQSQYYVLTRARNAATAAGNITAFENEKIYNIYNSDYEWHEWYVAKLEWDDAAHTRYSVSVTTVKDGLDSNEGNWLCSVDENGNVQFNHTFEVPEAAQETETVSARVAGSKDVVLSLFGEAAPATYDGLGNITINDMTVKSSAAITNGNATTTGITEVSLSNTSTIYDLQGRKLAAPVKGVNIINGKKVLVK